MHLHFFGNKAAPATTLASSRIPDIPFSALPRGIARKLRAAAARIRRILFLRGLFAVLATALVAILASMALDCMLTITDHTVRWILWGIGVGAVALVARQTLVKPLSQKFTPARLAALLERNHPELQERLSTVVELLSMPDAVGEGSELLLDVVKSAAEADVGGISPRREFSVRSVRSRFVLASGALLVLVGLVLVWPKEVGRLIARAVVPAAEIDNVWADNLRVSPGRDEFVLEGEPYTIHLAVVGGFPGKAYVRCKPLDGSTRETSERMAESAATEEDGTGVRHYSHTIASVDKSFSYYVVCGSAVTRAYDVVALPVPDFAKPTVTLDFPAYTGAAPQTLPEEAGLDVSAVAGTKVALRIVPNGTPRRPVHAQLAFADGHVLAAEETDGSPVSWEFRVTAQNAGPFEIRLFDDNGFTNAPSVHDLSLLEDKAPVVSFTSPTNMQFVLPAHGAVPVAYRLEDDFGVSAPMLQVKVDAGAWRDWRPLPAEPSGSVAPVRSGSGEIRLSALETPPKAGAQFRLRARDNLPASLGGPHESFSPVIAIRLDGAARTIASKRLQQAGEKAKAKADDIEKNLAEAMEKTREARREQLAGKDEKAAEKLAEAKEAVAKAEEKARQMMREMKDGDLAALAKDAKDLLEQTLEPAREKADDAIAAKPEERVAKIDQLLEKLDGAADAAKDLQEKRKALEKELKAAREIEELASKQEMLAKELGKEMTPEEKAAWDAKQQALLDELKKKREEMSADPLAAQREKAEDLAKRYAALARRQQALENTAAALGKDPAAAKPREALAKATPDQPENALDSERLAAAQEPLAREAEELAREVGALVRSLPVRALTDASNPVSDARREANTARDRARAAAEEANLRVRDEIDPPKDDAGPSESPAAAAPSAADDDDEFGGGLDDLLTSDDLAALAAAAPPRKDLEEEMKGAAAGEERAAQLLAASAKAIDELSKKMGEENMEAAKRAQEAMEAAKEAMKNREDPLAKQREKAQDLARRFEELANRQDALEREQKKGATEKLAADQRELASDVSKLRNELDDLARTIPAKTAAATTVLAARSDSDEARREANGAAEEAQLRAGEKDGPKKKAEPPPPPTETDDFFGDEDEFGGGLDDLLTASDLEAIAHAEEPVRRDLEKTMERAEDALRRGKDKMDQAAKAIDELSKKLAQGSMQDPSQQNQQNQQAQNQQNSQNQQNQSMDPSQMQPMDPSQMQQTAGDPNAQRDWNGDQDPNAQNERQDGEWDPNADRKWDGNVDPTAEVPIGEWDPNAEHAPWDGKKDPNAQDEQKDGQWDPNAEHAPWDGKKDPNAKDEPPKDGQWDPNRKKEPWDGKRDPNARQDQQQQGQQQQNKDRQQGQQDPQQGQQQQQQPQNAQQQAQQQAQNAADQMQQMSQQMQQQAGSQQQNQQQQGQQQQQQNQQNQQQQNQQGQQQDQQNQQDQQQQQNQQNSQQSGQHHDANKPLDPNSIGDWNPLRNLGVTDSDWLKVQNGGGAEALDAAVENVPPEYRDLVREYFEALANEK